MTDKTEVKNDNQSPPLEDDEKGKKEDTENKQIPKGEETSLYKYRDFNNVEKNDMDDIPAVLQPPPSRVGTETSIRLQKFPVKLNVILAQKEFNEVVTWMPHGRSWKVLKPKAFEALIMPLFFEYSNYHSFNRLVNAWSFRRISAGPDRGSYYHELFLRGKPDLQKNMRRLPKTQKKVPMKKGRDPNFYDADMFSPLPSHDESHLPATSIVPFLRNAAILPNTLAPPLSLAVAPPSLSARLGGLVSLSAPSFGMGGMSSGLGLGLFGPGGGLASGGLVPAAGAQGLGVMGSRGGGISVALRESRLAVAHLGEQGDSFMMPSSSFGLSSLDRLRRIQELQALEMEHQLKLER